MDWSAWRRHFEINATRPRPDLSRAAEGLPRAWQPRLASTVARLQAGETGEGRIVHQVRAHGLGDADYQAAMALFVAEEGRHAAILGHALRALGGTPQQDHWTARWFTFGRRAIGPRTKLLVLLAAEVIAVRFYEAMAEALPDGPLRSAFSAIRADEVAHLEFHTAFFAAECTAARHRAAFVAAWWPTAAACCATVLADHGPTLGALGVDRSRLARRMAATVRHVDRRVAGGAAPWFVPATADATPDFAVGARPNTLGA